MGTNFLNAQRKKWFVSPQKATEKFEIPAVFSVLCKLKGLCHRADKS